MYVDRHHLFFTKNSWTSRPQALQIRNTRSFIVPMTRDQHEQIHRNVTDVPLPGYHMLLRIVKNYQPTNDTLQSLDNFMLATDEAIRHPRAHQIEQAVGNLTMQALELQRPFLIDILKGER